MDNQQTEGEKQEAIKREMLRTSQDKIKVLNPTSEDYTVYWDKFPHLVSANGEVVLPRYIAQKYAKEMCDKILTFRSDENVRMENERRVKKGVALMDKHTEQLAFESKFMITQQELREPVMRTLWGGVVEEYGKNIPLQSDQPQAVTSDADLLAKIEASQGVIEPISEEPATLADEVTNDKE